MVNSEGMERKMENRYGLNDRNEKEGKRGNLVPELVVEIEDFRVTT